MNAESILERLKESVRRIVPEDIDITSITLEGPSVVIYTKDFDKFSENQDIIKALATELMKRFDIRPDPSTLEEADAVEKTIREMVPEEAEIVDLFFDFDHGVVTIEAINPQSIKGKNNALLNDLKRDTGWNVKPVRAPPIHSKTVSDVRGYTRYNREERTKILNRIGRRIARPMLKGGDQFARITALGGFRQIGRSATLLHTKESRILIDCGLDPSSDDAPYFGMPEMQPLSEIDAVVITHAHMDHSGLLPVLFKYGYDGPVYCTPPTRDLMIMLQLDFIKLSYGESDRAPYEASHVRNQALHVIPLDYEKTTDISPDVKLTLYNAGHILGSSIAHFSIGNGFHNVAFTGDTKFEKTWLFNQANSRFNRLDSLVLESTYGGNRDVQPSRASASEELARLLQQATEKGGKVLIPVFAVGRSQEVMLVIEEMMRAGKLPQMPVYLDGMIWEATAIHTAYPEYLNSSLKTRIFQQNENPFLSPIFKRVETSEMRSDICHSPDPCIVLATSGMMQGGPVMEYFREWVDDPLNWLLFVGYQSEGSMGRTIQRGRKRVTLHTRGRTMDLDVKINVETVDGFSGHSDRKQLMKYISSLSPRPSKVVINHGEERKCAELATAIYQKHRMETRAPANLETVRLR
ncbi:MAG: beta-CASP ribonuclease aCPSF1 [Thermoplasmatales archaeon]|nr:beta-CASP ribonuclease aCPSF1 [Thermoplasmatales archaeon]